MKKFFKTAFVALGAAALFFAGCSSESGGGGSSSSDPQITKVNISEKSRASDSHSVVLVASSEGASLEGAEITYKFEVVSENAASVTLTEKNSAEGTVRVENITSEEQNVTVKVTATLGEKTVEGQIELTLAAKTDVSGSGNEGENTGSDKEGENTGSGNEGGNSGSGNEGGNTGSGSEPETPAVEEKGSVKITVTVDGSISCKKCGKVYNFKVQAENCEHYKCADCGTVYYSQAEVDSCTSHVTVIFKDSDENGNESVTMVIKSGSNVIPPSWEKENFALIWIDGNGNEADFDDSISLSEGETEKTVTFTAKWETTYTVTFKDESGTNADVTVDVISGEVVGSVPEWTREHFTFAGWTSSVAGLTTDSEITGDVTFTANWTEDAKYTVKFVDSDGVNAEDTQTVYNGEKANLPAWTKENYSLSWTSSVEGLTIDSAITGDVTFTANWTELPKCTNCGTHYATEDAANNCGKQEGCPKYGALTTITFSGTKTATVSSDNDAITAVVIGNVTKTDYVYNGEKYNPLLKMESSTSLKLTGVKNKKITIITCGYKTATKRNIKVAGTNYAASENDEVIIEDISDDEIKITKGDQLNVAVIFIE